ncbi:MAG TPA: glutamate--tRNA ligase [Candidatus Dependentiae bacterium]|nr:glutamate--tRNA ligase [Candidatus Dependentiae bacterium]HRQ62546.1 glutamate--tRNA ligase [Candidatus Dependentiae bacterium]
MSTHTNKTIRVRFAPSPTGHLHIGGLRTALFNWLFARHNGGTYLVRIEDTDLERSKPEYTTSILSSLTWADLLPDEPIVTQSQNIQKHKRVLQELLVAGKVYKCFCDPEAHIKRYQATHTEDNPFIKYDRYCRTQQPKEQGKPYVLRFALPDDRSEIVFDDLIRGRVTFPIDQFDDFIIARSDGTPMYNFVVIVDDHDMHISHVIRGEDHISNTPKQILLYEACGYEVPQFAHLPLILGPSGDRLSKRDAATSVLEYRTEGFLPRALENYLVRLGWAHGDQEIFTRDELIQYFSLADIGKKGSIFDVNKLRWVNSVYMQAASAAELYDYIVADVEPHILKRLSNWNQGQIQQVIDLYKVRVQTLRELVQEMIRLHDGVTQYDPAALTEWIDSHSPEYLQELIKILEKQPAFDVNIIKEEVKKLAKEHAIKLAPLAQLVRIALIGTSSGPGAFELLVVMNKMEAITRMQRLLDTIK